MIDATDVSLVFLGLLIIMVLLEVRKLSRKPEPTVLLEEQFHRLTEQMERIGRPQDMQLPGGAQIVKAGQAFETVAEQLERLGESTAALHADRLTEDDVRRFAAGVHNLRAELEDARKRFEEAADGLGQASEAMLAAGAALKRIEAQIEAALPAAPAPPDRPDPRTAH